MAQYIDKDALIAEIIRRRKAIPKEEDDKRLKAVYGNEAFVLTELLEYINTLEVKEMYVGRCMAEEIIHRIRIEIDKIYEKYESHPLIDKDDIMDGFEGIINDYYEEKSLM